MMSQIKYICGKGILYIIVLTVSCLLLYIILPGVNTSNNPVIRASIIHTDLLMIRTKLLNELNSSTGSLYTIDNLKSKGGGLSLNPNYIYRIGYNVDEYDEPQGFTIYAQQRSRILWTGGNELYAVHDQSTVLWVVSEDGSSWDKFTDKYSTHLYKGE